MEILCYCCKDDKEQMHTREPTDAILATQGFPLAICIDFNNLYFIFGMCIGIPELLIYGSEILSGRQFMKAVEG